MELDLSKYEGWTQNQLMTERKAVERRLRDTTAERIKLDRYKEGLEDLIQWGEAKDGIELQKNDCSRLHRLLEAMERGDVHRVDSEPFEPGKGASLLGEDNHVFVVKHDWLAVLGDENLPNLEEFKAPYPICTFEFRINDRPVAVIVCQYEDQLTAVGFYESRNGVWFSGEASDRERAPMKFAWKHVMACCTVLDAEVAEHNVTRAPSALNKKRVAAGKPKLFDFHTIDLARRHRTNALHAGEGSRKRLHFRRGHWRHYEAHKTWIRWCLVGDPALGFVDKDYSL